MTTQETTIFHRLIDEVVGTGDLDRADALVAADFVDHSVANGEPIIGLDNFKQGTATLSAASPTSGSPSRTRSWRRARSPTASR